MFITETRALFKASLRGASFYITVCIVTPKFSVISFRMYHFQWEGGHGGVSAPKLNEQNFVFRGGVSWFYYLEKIRNFTNYSFWDNFKYKKAFFPALFRNEIPSRYFPDFVKPSGGQLVLERSFSANVHGWKAG